MGKKRVFDEDGDAAEEPVSNETTATGEESAAAQRKVKVVKPLPPGYVCKACGAQDDHAIYNCPLKISKKAATTASTAAGATTGASTTEEAAAETPAVPEKKNKYVFVSGLPFEMNKAKLLELIHEQLPDPQACTLEMKDIFIVTFKDNPSKCRGLAYVTCHSEEQFQDCLKLNGVNLGRFNLTAVESSTSNASQRKPTTNQELQKKANKRFKSDGTPRCYRCGGAHDPTTCDNPRICYKCRGTDHLSKDCPMKKKQNN